MSASEARHAVGDRRRIQWFRIDNIVIDRYADKIGVYGLALYALLGRLATHYEAKDRTCSCRSAAEKLGISKSQAARAIEHLIRYKLIVEIPGANRMKPSTYELVDVATYRDVSLPGDTSTPVEKASPPGTRPQKRAKVSLPRDETIRKKNYKKTTTTPYPPPWPEGGGETEPTGNSPASGCTGAVRQPHTTSTRDSRVTPRCLAGYCHSVRDRPGGASAVGWRVSLRAVRISVPVPPLSPASIGIREMATSNR